MIKEEIIKKIIMNFITCGIGKIEEKDDKIVCYVNKKRCKVKDSKLLIRCHGIPKEYKKITKKYGLDKKIRYVIDDFNTSNKSVIIYGYDDCEVVIRNCNFSNLGCIYVAGKCIINDTNINTLTDLSLGANDLELNNVVCKNISNNSILISGNNTLKLNESTIGDNNNVVSLFADKIFLYKVNIDGSVIKIKGESIDSDKESIINAIKVINKSIDDCNDSSVNKQNNMFTDDCENISNTYTLKK